MLAPFCLAIASVFVEIRAVAQEPVAADERLTVIHAGTIITNTGKEIQGGAIVLAGGKIRSVGPTPEVPRNARVIDARELTVMPGLINPHTRFGLPRFNRTGVHGDLAALDEIRPRPDEFMDLAKAGFTAVALAPGGTGVPGRASVIRTAGDASKRVIASPSYLKIAAEKPVVRAALTKAQQEIEKVEKARKEFEEKQKAAASAPASAPASQAASAPGSQPASAPASQTVFQPPAIDPTHQALVDLLQKKANFSVLVEAGGGSDVLQMEDLFKKPGIVPAWMVRNTFQSDLFRVVEHLGKSKAKVIAWPQISRIPNSAERVHIVRELTRAGCEVSLVPLVDGQAEEHARMRGRAGELVREGWPREEALKSMTLNPAKLLGIENRFGTIETDREADLVFFDADPLTGLGRVERVMIAGEMVYDARKEDR